MRHEWEPHPDSETARRPFQVWRRCKACRKEQQKVPIHQWMRVVGYRWWPLVGRCKGLLS